MCVYVYLYIFLLYPSGLLSLLSFMEFQSIIFISFVFHHVSLIMYIRIYIYIYIYISVTVLLIGPQAADYYKCGDLLSKHYFQKYQKRGYDIKFDVIFDVECDAEFNVEKVEIVYYSDHLRAKGF